ncbi:MAG: hypothetical protein K1X39_13550 [Thermoflexales bacterium]|nr:hypothetical protein [Thermoflexales bacterium]
MNLQKLLPVAASIAIILVVAVLREKSRTLAAIVATMPINMPLAMWVVASGLEGEAAQPVLAALARNMFIGLIPGFVWLIVVFVGLRLGWPVLGAIAAAYVAWGALTAAAFAVGLFAMPATS